MSAAVIQEALGESEAPRGLHARTRHVGGCAAPSPPRAAATRPPPRHRHTLRVAAFKSRDDHRRARELEEARKAGTIPAERDEEGKEINPHIPQYMAQAPWYLNQDAPGLKHQRNLKSKMPVASVTDYVPRGQKLGPAATVFRKGACTNCGAMTHTAKDCVERPRKKGAKYSGKDIRPDEHKVEVRTLARARARPPPASILSPPLQMAFDYAGKRDHWAQYEASNHMELIKKHERETELRLKHDKQEKMAQLAAKEQARERRKQERRKQRKREGGGEEGESDGDTDTDTDDEGESVTRSFMRMHRHPNAIGTVLLIASHAILTSSGRREGEGGRAAQPRSERGQRARRRGRGRSEDVRA